MNRQLDELIRQPVWGIRPEELEKYEREYFEAKCQGSKERIDDLIARFDRVFEKCGKLG